LLLTCRDEGLAALERSREILARLEKHVRLERTLIGLKANIRNAERQRDELVAKAREKIGTEEAKRLIVARSYNLLVERFDSYLHQYKRGFIAAVENLWDKYAVTRKQILSEWEAEALAFNRFMVELGYE
jgi:type I restriction enzyme M protein